MSELILEKTTRVRFLILYKTLTLILFSSYYIFHSWLILHPYSLVLHFPYKLMLHSANFMIQMNLGIELSSILVWMRPLIYLKCELFWWDPTFFLLLK